MPTYLLLDLVISRTVGNVYKVTGKVSRTPMGGYGNEKGDEKAMTGPECVGCVED